MSERYLLVNVLFLNVKRICNKLLLIVRTVLVLLGKNELVLSITSLDESPEVA